MAFNISEMVKFSPEFDNPQLRSSKLLILSFLETAYVKLCRVGNAHRPYIIEAKRL
jgi:hypothetical protein